MKVPHARAISPLRLVTGKGAFLDGRLTPCIVHRSMVSSEKLRRELFGLLGVLGTSQRRRVPLSAQPLPATFDLGLKGEAQERPDRHDTRQPPNALRGKWRRDGGDDVRADERFQPQQNPSAKVGSIPLVGLAEHAANGDADTCELKKLGELVYKSVGLIALRQFLVARAHDNDLWTT